LNQEAVAERLEAIATLMELKGENPFKVKAFTGAARTIEGLEGDLPALVAAGGLRGIKGIGPALAEVITELVTTGRSGVYDELKAATPAGLIDLLEVPGLTPKKVKAIHEGLGVTTVGELEYACHENRLVSLSGFGPKTQEKIVAGLAMFKKNQGQRLYSEVIGPAEELVAAIAASPGVQRVAIVGDVRRRCEVVGGLELGVAGEGLTLDAGHLPGVAQVTEAGCRLDDGLAVTIHRVPPEAFPAALLMATGSRDHVAALAERAASQGLRLDTTGLWRGAERIEADEEGIYRELGLSFIPPERREAQHPIERPVPVLVDEPDLQGVFHVHTTYSDGAASLEQMARAAQAMGFRYLGISDHSQAAVYAQGLTPDRIREQHGEIDRLNAELDGIRLLKGIEADILADGEIDYAPETLKTFDFVIASVHSRFGLDEAGMTERLVRAIRHPRVTMLGHMMGRLLLSREPYALDVERVFREAAEHEVVIELNANPHRLDLDWRVMDRALELGVAIAINPDAHSVKGLADTRYGVGIARKGGATPERVLNTRSLNDLLAYLARRRERAASMGQ